MVFLDLTNPFKGKLELMTTTDGVHPDQDGHHYLATLVCNSMYFYIINIFFKNYLLSKPFAFQDTLYWHRLQLL